MKAELRALQVAYETLEDELKALRPQEVKRPAAASVAPESRSVRVRRHDSPELTELIQRPATCCLLKWTCEAAGSTARTCGQHAAQLLGAHVQGAHEQAVDVGL